jgi:tetratricopeptide (TPR) repeat protein
MNRSSDFEQALERARQLHGRGSMVKAERAYRELLVDGAHREMVLRALVDLYMERRRPDAAIAALAELTEEVPDQLFYYARLAGLLDGLGRTGEAIAHYQQLLKRQPGLATAHYNIALLYKKEKRYRDALDAYQEAVRLGIERVQEVYSNMGVLFSEMQQPGKAAEMLDRALEEDPAYVPALFNRGGLYEEAGDRERAVEIYRRILSIEPRHSGALARLVHAGRISDAADPLLASLEAAIDAGNDDALAREELLFARGKALDDLGRYDEAFAAYSAANELGKQRNMPYDPRATERAMGRVIEGFDRDWIGEAATESAGAPVFVCGMFRSGSTLVEQILSAHPSITAGGELDYLPWLISRRLAPYPQGVLAAPREALRNLGDAYLALLRELHPDSANITDKRPDNFLYLGLIKAIFPAARIVYTRRDAADNCLSIWFQQLGPLSYATDLENTAHYYAQHERLMRHWEASFPDNLFPVDYDELVRSPEPLLRRLLDFLGLEWDARCLNFTESDARVRTASIWQVREGLHERSSGRWKNYEPFIRDLTGPWQTRRSGR